MNRFTSIILLMIFSFSLAATSCKSSKSSVEKRIHKKRKKAGSQDCPMKDC